MGNLLRGEILAAIQDREKTLGSITRRWKRLLKYAHGRETA